MQFNPMCMMQSSMFLSEKLTQINMMLQSNYTAISRLENRINNLMDLNERIKKDLAVEKEGATSSTMLECRPSEEEKLLDTIFHKKDYGFYLGLKTPISMPLYKDRNFNLELGLFDRDHNPISNKNSISLQMALYSSSEKPELIEFNKQGNPIIKGNDSVELVGGSATFYKISIREVSSKFEKGVLSIVVYVKSPPLDRDDDVDYRSIKPFVIKGVNVRAKKV